MYLNLDVEALKLSTAFEILFKDLKPGLLTWST